MIALFWDWLDECLEAWFQTYGGLGNYPDDRKVKRGAR